MTTSSIILQDPTAGWHCTPSICAWRIEYHCGSLAAKRVLDFGCGTGATIAALARFAEKVCAFDIDDEATEIYRKRIREHDLDGRVQFYCGSDLSQVSDDIGSPDVILLNDVFEHIPLSVRGLRSTILRTLFDMLNRPGYLYRNDTANQLWPYDFHSTQLWSIPWKSPGSEWAYRKAVRKGRHSEPPKESNGSLGLGEVGAWGATYWEIVSYLRERDVVCVNKLPGHSRHLYYMYPKTWWRSIFEVVAYYSIVKLLRTPMNAFAQSIPNLVIKKP